MDDMGQFDFGCPADLYLATRRGMSRQTISYKRFPTGAEAIKYAVEVVGIEKLPGTALETETARLDADQIRALYQHDSYPLRRKSDPPFGARVLVACGSGSGAAREQVL